VVRRENLKNFPKSSSRLNSRIFGSGRKALTM
jgi:hypothetical protein